MMKKIVFLLSVTIVLLSSCDKEGPSLFKGDYSFKTSGSVIAETVTSPADSVSVYTIRVPHEVGQLNIAPYGSDSLLIVMNIMGGDVITTTACTNSNHIIFTPYSRNAFPLNISADKSINCDILVKAEGTMYDKNLLVLNMTYEGTAELDSVQYNITGIDITTACTRN